MTYLSTNLKYKELPTDVEFLGFKFRDCTLLGKFFDKFETEKPYWLLLFNSELDNKECDYKRKKSELKNGVLYIDEKYHWDGSSGPTIDDDSDAEASLIHDELYGAMKSGHLSLKYRKFADKLYRKLLIKNGKSKFTAWKRYFVLRLVGYWFARPKKK